MTTKTRVVAALGLLALALVLLWNAWGEPPAPLPGPGTGGASSSPLTAELSRDGEVEAAPETVLREDVTPAPAVAPTTGTLIVAATYEGDGAPVPDLTVMVGPPGVDHRVGYRRGRTDEHGVVRFGEVPAGRIWVQNTRNDHLVRSEITAGIDNEVDLVMPVGAYLAGIVVDRDAVPVPGAQVLLAPLARADRDIEHVADTGADGRFALRSCPEASLIGARAAGHSPSKLHFLFLQDGAHKEVRIELPAAGGTVAGTVLGPDRTPVHDAVVRIGEGNTSGLSSGRDGAPPPPALVRTDAEGRFLAAGLAAGEHPVAVRARGFAPWQGACRVQDHVITPLEVQLGAGMSCIGIVVDADDAPVEKAEIEVGRWRDFAHYRTFSGADGSFRLEGLPAGEVELRAEHDDHGKATVVVTGRAGETVEARLRLDTGLELRGRVLTANDEPVERAFLEVSAARTETEKSWHAWASTDADGSFAVTNCPEGRKLRVTVRGRGLRDKQIDDVDPRAGELVVYLEAGLPRSARIVGKVVTPDGTPAAHAVVNGWGPDGEQTGLEAASDAGEFEVGPLVPGKWRVAIEAEGHPRVWTEWHQLAADAVVDVGTIWLPPSGTVRVLLRGADGLQPRLALRDSESHWHHFTGEGDERRSTQVAPGGYVLSVSGTGVAAQLVPVDVRAGEETELELRVRPGHRQRFSFEAPTPLSERRVQVVSGGRTVVDTTYRARSDWAIPVEYQRWLAPGDYTVIATGDGLSGQVRFTVREGENEPVRVVLR